MKVLIVFACALAGIYVEADPCAGLGAGSYVSDPTDCSFYYQCMGPNYFRRPCPAGLLFNNVLKVCDWPAASGCGGGGGTGVTPTPGPGGVTAPCKSMNPETMPNTADCQKYTYCYNGYPYPVQCETGQFFSQKDNGCIAATTCPGDGGGVTNPPTTGFTCPSSPKTYPYPGDTSKYYYCYQNIAYVVQCDPSKHYVETTNSCSP